MRNNHPVSILYKSIAGRYRPVRAAGGPITARYKFIKNASWARINCSSFFPEKMIAVLWLESCNKRSNKLIPAKYTISELQSQKSYLQICAPSEDSETPAHPRSFFKIFTGRILDSRGWKGSSCWQLRLLRQRGWAGWFVSTLSAYFRRYVSSCWGSYEDVYAYDKCILLYINVLYE